METLPLQEAFPYLRWTIAYNNSDWEAGIPESAEILEAVCDGIEDDVKNGSNIMDPGIDI